MKICYSLSIMGELHKDLIKAHIHSSSQENFKREGDWVIFLNDLKDASISWNPTWLHGNAILMHGTKEDHILLMSFHGIEGFSPNCVVRQFVWIQPIHLPGFIQL